MSIFSRNEDTKTFFLRYPAVTLITLAIILVQAATYLYGNGATDPETARRFGAIQTGDNAPEEWFRLATYLFVQIGGAYHILANVTSLLIFGPPLERIYGSSRFTFLYFATGMAGGLFILLFSEDSIAAGASGSIFGLIGLYLGLVLQQNKMINAESKQIIWSLFIGNIIFTFAVPNISIAAHLGGLVGGLLLSFFIPQPPFRRIAETSWMGNNIQIVGVAIVWFSLLSAPTYLPAATQNEWTAKFEQVRANALDKLGKTSVFSLGTNTNNTTKAAIIEDVNWSKDKYNQVYSILNEVINAYNEGISSNSQMQQLLRKINQQQNEINLNKSDIANKSFTPGMEEQQSLLIDLFSTLNEVADQAKLAISSRYDEIDNTNFSDAIDEIDLKAKKYNQSLIDLYEEEGIQWTYDKNK